MSTSDAEEDVLSTTDEDGRVHKWAVEPHPFDSEFDVYVTDDDQCALEAIQLAAENAWDRLEPGQQAVIRIRMSAMTDAESHVKCTEPGVCPECKGSCRTGSGYLREDCPACNGTGQQPAQPGSGEASIQQCCDDLFEAGRTVAHYEDPRLRPLSKEDFILGDAARKRAAAARARLQSALAAAQQRIATLTAEVMHYTAGTPHPAEQREAELRGLLARARAVLDLHRVRGDRNNENVIEMCDAIDNLPNGNLPSADI